VAAVITQLSETVACLRIFIASTYTYIIFDPHSIISGKMIDFIPSDLDQ